MVAVRNYTLIALNISIFGRVWIRLSLFFYV
jgi:hypothetical protein